MGGRLRGGDWNVALFETASGNRLKSYKTGYRVTDMQFTDDAKTLVVVGTQGQPKDKKDGAYPNFELNVHTTCFQISLPDKSKAKAVTSSFARKAPYN